MQKPSFTIGLAGVALLLSPPVVFHARNATEVGAAVFSNAASLPPAAPVLDVPISAAPLHESRSSPLDLELGGELAGLPSGLTRYITRADLLALPQVTYTVTDDTNFSGPTEVSGVLLEEVTRQLSAAPESDMAIAICDDLYRAHYPHNYVSAHHPLLVLKIDGQPPDRWPKDAERHALAMGPYMISHAKFAPRSEVPSHDVTQHDFTHYDEPQIPWGVVRLEFGNEAAAFAAIAPRGAYAADSSVQTGYRIAQQNCFRCHNMGLQGGQKAARSWQELSAWAMSAPEYFAAYVRNPRAKNPRAQMPGNPSYDDATIRALSAYFQTFSAEGK